MASSGFNCPEVGTHCLAAWLSRNELRLHRLFNFENHGTVSRVRGEIHRRRGIQSRDIPHRLERIVDPQRIQSLFTLLIDIQFEISLT